MSEKVEKQVDLNSLASTFLRERSVAYAPPISRRLVGAVRREMVKGIKAGERIGDMVGRVRKILDDQAPFRALKIVRTEVVGAFNAGTLEGYNQTPEVVKKKEWLTARDANVRPTQPGDFNHQTADTQRRNVGDPFSVSGESLMHPGDPAGSPGNIINCRCTMLPVTSRNLEPPPPPPTSEEAAPSPVATPRPRPGTRPRSTKPPQRLTDAQVAQQVLLTAEGETATKWLERSLLDDNFRNKVMVDKIAKGTKSFRVEKLSGGAWGQFSTLGSVVRLDTGLATESILERAKVFTHEMFHGTTHERRWFNKFGALKINLKNPEAARLFELYNKALDRVEEVLEKKATGKVLGISAFRQKESKKWLGKIRKERKRLTFGKNYTKGLTDWKEMRQSFVVGAEEAGIPRAYSLHSPHEYATTSFEKFVFEPDVLKRRDPDMFNFFENFYKEGVFKRAVLFLRRRQ